MLEELGGEGGGQVCNHTPPHRVQVLSVSPSTKPGIPQNAVLMQAPRRTPVLLTELDGRVPTGDGAYFPMSLGDICCTSHLLQNHAVAGSKKAVTMLASTGSGLRVFRGASRLLCVSRSESRLNVPRPERRPY